MKTVHILTATALLLCGNLAVQAQGVQRIVGPDGKVTYTDRAGVGAPVGDVGTQAPTPAAGIDSNALPFGLRQAVQRYPVLLYTTDKCNACNGARTLLSQRGVPFVEKTVTTPEDGQAFAQLGVENALPLITIGSQRITGFVANDLNRYLDAAGYPAQSQLPRNHRNPPPQALAPAATPSASSTQTPTEVTSPPAVSAPPPAVAPQPSNPAGIRF